MSFITDLITWKKRSEVEYDLVDDTEELFGEDDPVDVYDDYDDDGFDLEQSVASEVETEHEDHQAEDFDLSEFTDMGVPEAEPVDRPGLSAIQAQAADNPVEDAEDGDPDDILARVAMMAAAKPEPREEPRARPVITAVPRSVPTSGAKIWDLKSGSSAPKARPVVTEDRLVKQPMERPAAQTVNGGPVHPVDLPAAQLADAGPARGGRVKTRLLGFHNPGADGADIFDSAPTPNSAKGPAFPTGWLVVIKGPGKGSSFTLGSGVNQIGRGEDQTVSLDFGDMSISRNNHAAVAYDEETDKFFLGHGGKSNLVRLNDRPVLSTEPLVTRDLIRIGETTLCFVAFCAEGFSWT